MIRSTSFAQTSSKLITYGRVFSLLSTICLLVIFNEYLTTEQKTTLKETTNRFLRVTTGGYEKTKMDTISSATYAVVHVGPRKTGTSSIQESSKKYRIQLEEDGYEMPMPTTALRTYAGNGRAFSECFRAESVCTKDGQERVASGLEIAKRKKNIIISSENFSYYFSFEELSKYLSNWDHTIIIIYYRRYYDWLCSHYHELLRLRTLKDTKLWDMTLLDYLKDEVSNRVYTTSVFSLLKQAFDNIIVMDFHDKSQSLVKGFYCDAVPGAHNTCQAVANDSAASATGKVMKKRVSISPVWGDLAYAANSIGLIEISSDNQMNFAKSAIRKHQEKDLGMTRNDFKLNCLSNETLQKLLESSLEYELTLFPERNGTDLKSDFEKAATSDMCEVDLNAILEDPGWLEFFKLLAEKLSSVDLVNVEE